MATPRLTADTLVPLGSALAVIGALFRAWLWIQGQIEVKASLEERVRYLEARPVVPFANRWTCYDQKDFVAQLKILNPKLSLPKFERDCQP